jgi:hypothetical protein
VLPQVPAIYSAGKFIDDFKIDNTFRNDIGCVYVARIQGGVITRYVGHTTGSQAGHSFLE